MSKFRGTFTHSIDSKGRLSVPTRFREVLKARTENQLVVTRGTHTDCLSVFPLSKWQEVEEGVDQLPTNEVKDAFVRHFIAPAQDVTLDKMGRVLIPVQLREEAGLDHEVMVVGALSKFEVWDRERWEEYERSTRQGALEILNNYNINF
jgi:MraZ protein